MVYAIAIAGVLATLAIAVVLVVKQLTVICQPNEVLVFSGGSRGVRVVHGGRTLRVPLFERVDRLDLTNMVIDLQIKGAYARGGIPLDVQGVANVKIASDAATLKNAIERFLDVPRGQIVGVAKETLEGNLRGVLATLTPEEINQDRVKFAESLLHEGDTDLKKLGLSLDMLKIQHVSDEVGFLDSLGRKQSADLQMRSRIAEADNRAQAAVRDAENTETRELARIQARTDVARAEAERRVRDALTRRDAVVAEARAEVQAQVARARADTDVQRARIAQVEMQLTADRLRPAEAKRDHLVARAKAEAARIVEDGRATATAIREMVAVWDAHGDEARQVLLAQKLEPLVRAVVGTVDEVEVDSLAMCDGDGLGARARLTTEQLKHAVGIDVPALLSRLAPAS